MSSTDRSDSPHFQKVRSHPLFPKSLPSLLTPTIAVLPTYLSLRSAIERPTYPWTYGDLPMETRPTTPGMWNTLVHH